MEEEEVVVVEVEVEVKEVADRQEEEAVAPEVADQQEVVVEQALLDPMELLLQEVPVAQVFQYLLSQA